MEPWETAEQLSSSENPEPILAALDASDPFWVGASYALDPFVGILYRLPLRDPFRYGGGVPAAVFDKLATAIIGGDLTGDPLVLGVEVFSKHCREDEWCKWYRPILQGNLHLQIPLDMFNTYCPETHRIPPPALNHPRPIKSLDNLPSHFVLQPAYPEERVFYLIDSISEPTDIRGYDSQVRPIRNKAVFEMLSFFAASQSMNVVLTGFLSRDELLVEDILTRAQFTQEGGSVSLLQRLTGLLKLGLPLVQLSEPISCSELDVFYNELDLILQQGYAGAIARDLDANYPFRAQPDLLLVPALRGTAIVTSVASGGFTCEHVRGKKTTSGMVRLGLTAAALDNISEATGRRFEMYSCGSHDGEIVLPVFKRWK